MTNVQRENLKQNRENKFYNIDEEEMKMTGKSLLKDIIGLAKCQGSYGRMLNSLREEYRDDEELIIDVLDEVIMENDLNDFLDFVMLMEG